MIKPQIGINPYYYHHEDSLWNGTKEEYFTAVWKGGGFPVTLHHPSNGATIGEIAERIDGLLLVGGPDIPNTLYNGQHPELMDMEVMLPEREKFDREVFLATRQLGKPILAICAGFQHINVISGGTLYEDISAQMEHAIDHGTFKGNWTEHAVILDETSVIYSVMGASSVKVASTHHQGIRNLGKGLKAVGHSPDGLMEAVEDRNNPESFLAVQWHPELMLDRPEQLALFQWLVEHSA